MNPESPDGKPTQDLLDRVTPLLEQVLDAPLAAQAGVLATLCAQHADCAALLRQGYGSLQRLDLVQISHAEAAPAAMPASGGLPRSLGPFRLIEFLGAGGMGAVYRAEDEELKRPVALKLVRGELLASARVRSRFQRESEALARLDHPGLCTVYRAGTTEGQPWIAMRLVRGITLAAALDTRRQATPPQRARGSSSSVREDLAGTLLVFEKIARALATAHAAGVVHRDLKPANVVLTSGDEPVVIDFGLVHLAGADAQLTHSGDHIGTPAYMAPEQIAPAGREPDARTDVYALAVTLFEALTLQLPYPAHGREQLFQCIVRGERQRLRQVRRGLPADLEIVLEKALDPEPARRYASMTELAEDLRRVRQHEPPLARRIGPALRMRRWCQRNPVAATFVTLLGLGLAATLAFTLELRKLGASREAARQRSLAMAYANLAGTLLDDNPEHALDLALRAVDLAPGDPETLGMLVRALQEVRPHQTWRLPWETRVRIDDLVVSPRGDAALVLGSRSMTVQVAPVLWRNGAEPTVLKIANGTFDAHWAPDGSLFVTAGPHSPPQLWSPAQPEAPLARLQVPDAPAGLRVPRVRFLPDGEHLLLACSDGLARLHNRRTGTWTALLPRLCLDPDRPGMRGLAISGDGTRIALGDQAGRLVVHDTAAALQGREGRCLNPDPEARYPHVQALELSQEGRLLQVWSSDLQQCAVWTCEGTRLDFWGDAESPASPMPIDPTQERIVRVVLDRMPELWRHAQGVVRFEQALAGHVGGVRSGRFRADGRLLLTVGVDETARVWDPDRARTLLTLRGCGALRKCAFLGGGDQCLLVSDDALHRIELPGPREMLRVGALADFHALFPGPGWPGWVITADGALQIRFHQQDGTLREIREEPPGGHAGLQLSPDGRWLVSTSWSRDGQTQAVVYGPDLKEVDRLSLPMARPLPVFGPDHQLLLIDVGVAGGGAVQHWAPSAPGRWTRSADAVQQVFAAACTGARAAAWHAPTATLAIAAPGSAVTLCAWNGATPGLGAPRTLLRGIASAHRVAFSPDGRRLLLAGDDGVVRLVDREGHELARIAGHLGQVVAVEFAPRGGRILVAATESGVTVHDDAATLVLPIRPPAGERVTTAAFLPEGDRVLIATAARSTRIVPIAPQRLVELARSLPRPEMSEMHRRAYQARVGD